MIVDRVLDSPLVRELVIVDDGSTDDTLQTALGFDDPRVRVFAQPINLGKGAALRRGFREVAVAVRHRAGRRPRVRPRRVPHRARSRCSTVTPTSCTGRASSAATRTASSTTGTPSGTGSSRRRRTCSRTSTSPTWRPVTRRSASRSSAASRSRRTGSGSSPRSPRRSPRQGWRIYEVGISYNGRTYAEGKKIGWRDGARAVYSVVRYSPAWSGVRERIDRAPDRNLPPAQFEDADAELSTVLESLEGAEHYADWILSLAEPHLGERRARDRRRSRRDDPAPASRTTR